MCPVSPDSTETTSKYLIKKAKIYYQDYYQEVTLLRKPVKSVKKLLLNLVSIIKKEIGVFLIWMKMKQKNMILIT